MPKKQAVEETEPVEASEDGELDQAISDLRGVLEEDAAGATEASEEDAVDFSGGDFSGGDFSMDDFPDAAGDGDASPLDDATPAMAEPSLDMGAFGSDSLDMQTSTGASGPVANTDIILDIPVEVQIVLGKTRMTVSNLMKLDEGATISLDRRIGGNGRHHGQWPDDRTRRDNRSGGRRNPFRR